MHVSVNDKRIKKIEGLLHASKVIKRSETRGLKVKESSQHFPRASVKPNNKSKVFGIKTLSPVKDSFLQLEHNN